jgi:uncharacterized protein YdhG (YjbR/CyaY superfamily)
MQSKAETVDEYLSELPAERREALGVLRALVREVVPEAREEMRYGMAYYDYYDGQLAALASQKQYMALYLCDGDLVEAARPRLGKLDIGKSCIRFRRLEQLPLDVIRELLEQAARHREAQA